MNAPLYIGTAGWNVPAQIKNEFPYEGTHLERYAQRLNCVEINSSFYREHKRETYVRWARSVPEHFCFSVKLSKYFSHAKGLQETGARLQDVLDGISGLGEKWKILLIQLPPKLDFNFKIVSSFAKSLKKLNDKIDVLWEPRHVSWAWPSAIELLASYGMSKVLADPEPCPVDSELLQKIRYFRLHGSPEIYKSRYSVDALDTLSKRLVPRSTPQSNLTVANWCIFDNTTYGYAAENALELKQRCAF